MTFTPDRFHEFYERGDVVAGYDARRGRTPALRAVRRRELDFFLGHLRPDASVCEIGAGTGFVTRRLLEHGPVYAVEPSPAMREQLTRDLDPAPGLTLADGDIQHLDLPRRFDAIVSSRVLIHFDQQAVHEIVAAVTRFLEPGGVFLFDVSTPWIVRYYLARVVPKVPHTCLPVSVAKLAAFVATQPDLRLVDRAAVDHRVLLSPLVAAGELFPRSNRLERALLAGDRGLSSVGALAARWLVAVERTA
ncbi:MAG TPA: class I SAM-dependent methyltransferase [Acidimicrobiia bacterium]|nr:class I SAM-dependent methyltransferase [Acidimicrobiia bacterium]